MLPKRQHQRAASRPTNQYHNAAPLPLRSRALVPGDKLAVVCLCLTKYALANPLSNMLSLSHSMRNKPLDYDALADKIKQWALELRFQQVGITDLDLSEHEATLQQWLEN